MHKLYNNNRKIILIYIFYFNLNKIYSIIYMSANLRHHRIFPNNKRTTIGSLENIDFDISFPNRKIVCNSIRVEGKVIINSTGNTRVLTTNDIYVDNMIGANSFFESYETSSNNRGILEYFQNAPRYHKMVSTGFNVPDDMANVSNTCELKSQSLQLSRNVFYGNCNQDVAYNLANPNTSDGQSFSVKPFILLNQVQRGVAGGDVNLDNQTLGDIRLSIRTAKNTDALFGAGCTDAANYQLSDVALSFHTIASDGKQSPLIMRTKQVVRQSIQSGLGSVTVNVPQLTNGVSISTLQSAKMNTATFNANQLDRPTAVSQVQFMINDSPSDFIAYQLRSENEILHNYLESISKSKLNSYNNVVVKANEAYGIGCNFYSLLDLSRDRFGVNISSGITDPYTLFMYYHGVMNV